VPSMVGGDSREETRLNPRRRATGCAVGCLTVGILLVAVVVVGFQARHAWLPVVGRALNVASDLQPADVIIVLGGGDGDRAVYAGQLYHQGLARHVIATGSPTGTDSGATGLVAQGVPRDAIVLANGSQNTHEDAILSKHLMEENTWRTALLVTDPYHARRSLWTFRTEFQDGSLLVRSAPVVHSWFNADRWWTTEEGFVAVNEEYLKTFYYLVRGYIRPAVLLAK